MPQTKIGSCSSTKRNRTMAYLMYIWWQVSIQWKQYSKINSVLLPSVNFSSGWGRVWDRMLIGKRAVTNLNVPSHNLLDVQDVPSLGLFSGPFECYTYVTLTVCPSTLKQTRDYRNIYHRIDRLYLALLKHAASVCAYPNLRNIFGSQIYLLTRYLSQLNLSEGDKSKNRDH